MNSQDPSPKDAEEGGRASEVLSAVRNGIQLGGSLLVTYAIAMGVRFLLPRYLGPEAYGHFNWADGFSATFFVAINLGQEMYIRKEVSRRPEHASDFFGTTLLMRVAMTGLLLVALGVAMHGMDEPPEVRHLVYVFAVAQLLVIVNGAVAALLHAKGRVAGLSISNVVTKLVWGGGLLAVVAGGLSLPWLAVPLVASEAVKLAVGWYLARQHLGLRFRLDFKATGAVLKASLPFFLTAAALTANGRTDVSLLGVLASKEEVGWYGAAWNIAGLAFLVSPIFGWVLMPLMSRAAARSEAELTAMTRRSLEGALAVTIPVMMLIVMGSDLWVDLAYGGAFAEAAMPLRVLSPIFVLSYVTMVSSTWLNMTNREWRVTLVTTSGMVINPLLNLLLIPLLYSRLGNSGGATATALSMLLMEIIITIAFLGSMGRASFDKRSLTMLAKTVGVCLFIVAADRTFLADLLPAVRLAVEATAYVVLVLATGAVRPAEVLEVVRVARRRGAPAAEVAVATPTA